MISGEVRVIVPTCKKYDEIASLVYLMETSRGTIGPRDVYCTCQQVSAAKNRNLGLDICNIGDIVIMVDDDIINIPDNWDLIMVDPFYRRNDIVLSSARLLNVDGSVQPVMGGAGTHLYGYVEVPLAPTAMCAFIYTGIRFDENYVGSGWEDTDFCRQLKKEHNNKKFIINNDIRVTHSNEMKNQQGEVYVRNRRYYNAKWGANE